uniref:Methyltransferase n=1 Tax=Coccolithus braarudii TaxID=221442 RepID=A0A7S0L804_9EUKA
MTQQLVKEATGADRVVTFDHTLRESGQANLNAVDGKSAAGAVVRVHGDYTPASGPTRLRMLNESGRVDAAVPSRYAFVNVWRNIDRERPVLANPLAVCAPYSIDLADAWPYLMMYPDRVGENYALKNESADAHQWFYYPLMVADEALLFKVFDSAPDETRFVFHSAFEDPSTPADAPPRRSVEVRTIALWD